MRRGSPIRTSSDHSPFIGSPRLIADFHVLHRLLMPRHPPCALTHSHPPLEVGISVRENITLRFFDSKKITLHTSQRLVLDARVHYTILKPLPITTPASTSTAAASGLGRCLVKPLVVPGPNSVSVLSDHPPTVPGALTPARLVGRAKYVMFHP